MEVRYRCDIDSPSGYSRASRMHIRALLQCGVGVKVEHRKKDKATIVPDKYWEARLPTIIAQQPDPDPTIRIWHETPDFFSPDAKDYNIAMVPWETSKIVAEDLNGNPRNNWVKQFNRMDEMWVNATSTKKAFVDSGVTKPVYVFPHPIDLDFYTPGEREPIEDEYGNPMSANRLTFLSVFQWNRRKNPAGLLLGYWTTFDGFDDVLLCIKTYGLTFENNIVGNLRKEMRSLKQATRLSAPADLLVIWDHIPEGELPDLYRSCDVFVALPYGEGFGLPFQESMACGKPVIYPRSSSMLDFCTDEAGYGVEVDEEPVMGMQSPWYDAKQMWWRPQYKSTHDAFMMAYTDWKSGRLDAKGKAARKRIEELHSFEKVGTAMRERLEAIQASR